MFLCMCATFKAFNNFHYPTHLFLKSMPDWQKWTATLQKTMINVLKPERILLITSLSLCLCIFSHVLSGVRSTFEYVNFSKVRKMLSHIGTCCLYEIFINDLRLPCGSTPSGLRVILLRSIRKYICWALTALTGYLVKHDPLVVLICIKWASLVFCRANFWRLQF